MKKIFSIILAAAMILSLAACGNSQSSAAPAAASSVKEASSAAEAAVSEVTEAPAAPAAEEAQEAAPAEAGFTTVAEGMLTMGTNAAFPPYEYYEGQEIVGIDAEVAGMIADKLGLTLQIVDMDFGSIITSVQTGKIDIGVAGMTVTEERLKNVNFTDSYSTGVQVVIVKEDSDVVQTLDDLDGALIGCQEATTGYLYCCDDYGEENVIAYTNGPTAVKALVDGKVDCVVIDEQPALAFVAANEGLKILDTEYVVEDYAIAVSKDNEPLLAAINGALQEMIADGTVQKILDKYIAAEDNAETAAAPAGDFTTVAEGTLTMGTNAAFPPYEYYEGQEIVGIDAEVATAIAEKLGLTLEIVDMDFGSIITSVQTGKIDIGVAGMTVTEERLKNVNFSDSYSTGVQVVIVKEDSDVVQSLDDLDGALIGCQEATTGYLYCCDDYGEENVIAYTNGPTAVKALVDGKVDCVVIDEQPALAFVEANEGLKILDTEYVVEDYAIAVSKENEPLLAAINGALQEMIADGTVSQILDKYIKE